MVEKQQDRENPGPAFLWGGNVSYIVKTNMNKETNCQIVGHIGQYFLAMVWEEMVK